MTPHDIVIKALTAVWTGFGAAVAVDVALFLQSNSWSDFGSKWDVRIASFRWIRGIVGALVSAGLFHLGAAVVG